MGDFLLDASTSRVVWIEAEVSGWLTVLPERRLGREWDWLADLALGQDLRSGAMPTYRGASVSIPGWRWETAMLAHITR